MAALSLAPFLGENSVPVRARMMIAIARRSSSFRSLAHSQPSIRFLCTASWLPLNRP
ncbi:hypothetical protein [Paludibacterium denitrificans]|uniref:hypothetical protein n=1 Tax=Paludibacterium denitrificans TaxID=2675226 RepID=UPI002477E275|nr:hypothetical protein [Paludibacterium denitrificans]